MSKTAKSSGPHKPRARKLSLAQRNVLDFLAAAPKNHIEWDWYCTAVGEGRPHANAPSPTTPTMKSLERAGFVVSRVERKLGYDEYGLRTIYTITDAGREQVASPSPLPRPFTPGAA